jgi:hypothetical protein
VSNRAERRWQQRVEGGRYRVPDGIVYDEFVGELRPASGRAFTELHVRYRVWNGLYVDWSLTLQARFGGLEEFRDSPGAPLERRKIEVVDVSASAIRRHTYNPDEPEEPPQTAVIVPLHAGDHARVDHEYMVQLNELARSWSQKHGVASGDRRNTAVWRFVEENRRPAIRTGDVSWVRNTLICVEDDPADAVLSERAGYYFPNVKNAQGVLRSTGRMQFITAAPGGRLTAEEAQVARDNASHDGVAAATGDVTMGMLVDSIYSGDWTGEVDDFLGGR